MVSFVASLTVALLASVSLIHLQAEGAATVNGHVEPKGSIEAGQRATLVLDVSTSPIFGNEFVDSDGRFLFEVKATLRLVGNPDFEPIDFGQGGLALKPDTAHQEVKVTAPHNLTIGKWLINATVIQYDLQHNAMVVDMNPDRWDFDVVERKDYDYGPLLTIMGWGVGLATTVVGGIYVLKWARKHPHKPDVKKDKRAELQKINEQMRALPPEYMQNLRYHYCKLKNNGKPIDFSYHPRPALRNQADTIEQTLDAIASTVLDGAVDFREFKRLHGPFVLRAWVLCEEDITIKAKTYPSTGSKFRQLFNRLAKTMEVPEISCSDVTEKM